MVVVFERGEIILHDCQTINGFEGMYKGTKTFINNSSKFIYGKKSIELNTDDIVNSYFAVYLQNKFKLNLKNGTLSFWLYISDTTKLTLNNCLAIFFSNGTITGTFPTIRAYISRSQLSNGWNNLILPLSLFEEAVSGFNPCFASSFRISFFKQAANTTFSSGELLLGLVTLKNCFYPSSSRFLKTKYPIEKGLTAGITSQTGNKEELEAQVDLVSSKERTGIEY